MKISQPHTESTVSILSLIIVKVMINLVNNYIVLRVKGLTELKDFWYIFNHRVSNFSNTGIPSDTF